MKKSKWWEYLYEAFILPGCFIQPRNEDKYGTLAKSILFWVIVVAGIVVLGHYLSLLIGFLIAWIIYGICLLIRFLVTAWDLDRPTKPNYRDR